MNNASAAAVVVYFEDACGVRATAADYSAVRSRGCEAAADTKDCHYTLLCVCM